MAVHRIIEANAAKSGDLPAIADTHITLSYRELNLRANAVARHLMANGFRRGSLATVRAAGDIHQPRPLIGADQTRHELATAPLGRFLPQPARMPWPE